MPKSVRETYKTVDTLSLRDVWSYGQEQELRVPHARLESPNVAIIVLVLDVAARGWKVALLASKTMLINKIIHPICLDVVPRTSYLCSRQRKDLQNCHPTALPPISSRMKTVVNAQPYARNGTTKIT